MGFNQDKYPRRSFQNPRKDNLFRNNRYELFQTYAFKQDPRGNINFDENNFASLAENLSSELQREYPLIMSIYKLEDHWELDRSDTSSTKKNYWDDLSLESYEGIKDLNLVLEWKVASRDTKEIELFLNIKAISNNFTWNFRKKENFPPAEFSMIAPIETSLKLFWNEDYCLDIAKPGKEIISIWFSTRDYT